MERLESCLNLIPTPPFHGIKEPLHVRGHFDLEAAGHDLDDLTPVARELAQLAGHNFLRRGRKGGAQSEMPPPGFRPAPGTVGGEHSRRRGRSWLAAGAVLPS